MNRPIVPGMNRQDRGALSAFRGDIRWLVVTALGLVLLAQVAAASPAAAHTALVSTSPADGASLTDAPDAVTLTFSQPVNAELSAVEVTGPGGEVRQQGPPDVSGVTVTQPLAGLSSAGTYQVAWRVLAADGHPVSGTLSFTLTASEAAGSGAPEAEDPALDDAVSSTEGSSAPPAAGASVAPTVASADGRGVGVTPLVALLAAVVAVPALGWVVLRRRRAG